MCVCVCVCVCVCGGGGGGGGGPPLEPFFRGLRVRLIRKLSVILLLIGVSNQQLLFSSMIVFSSRLSASFTAYTIVYVT